MSFDVDDVVSVLEEVRPLIRQRYGNRLEKTVRARLDPVDLFQSVALRAIVGFEGFNGQERDELKHWVLTIARNTCMSMLWAHIKCHKRSTHREGPAVGSTDPDDPFSEPAGWAADPEVLAVMKEQRELVLGALGELPTRQATAVRMRYVESRSYEEIATSLDCTCAAARKLVSRGLSATRRELGIGGTEIE